MMSSFASLHQVTEKVRNNDVQIRGQAKEADAMPI
jgi:hypothetical protein